MKVYDEGNCLFGTLTLNDLGVTQSQVQKGKFHFFSLCKPL